MAPGDRPEGVARQIAQTARGSIAWESLDCLDIWHSCRLEGVQFGIGGKKSKRRAAASQIGGPPETQNRLNPKDGNVRFNPSIRPRLPSLQRLDPGLKRMSGLFISWPEPDRPLTPRPSHSLVRPSPTSHPLGRSSDFVRLCYRFGPFVSSGQFCLGSQSRHADQKRIENVRFRASHAPAQYRGRWAVARRWGARAAYG